MATFAAETNVTSERSRMEIERILNRYGAQKFMYAYDMTRAFVSFETEHRQVRFVLPLPDRDAAEFKWTSHKPPRRRTVTQQTEAYEQGMRQRWRALALVIKAKLEAVEAGIVTFDAEFLAHLVMPNGRTVGDEVRDKIFSAYETGEMPALLPEYGQPALTAK